MKKNIFLFCIFFILFSLGAASAQDTLHSRFGVSFGLADNIHSADISALPNTPGCCAHFTSGDGSGFALSLLYEYPLTDIILLSARLGYTDHSATLSSDAGQAVIVNNGIQTVPVTRVIDLVASSYGIEPRVEVRVIKGLILSAGLRIGFVSSAKFIQRDTFLFTSSGGKDTSGVLNQYAGNLPNASSVLLHGIFSLGYEFPLGHNRTTFFVPEITYTPAFTDLIKGLKWKTNAVTFAIAMKFSLN